MVQLGTGTGCVYRIQDVFDCGVLRWKEVDTDDFETRKRNKLTKTLFVKFWSLGHDYLRRDVVRGPSEKGAVVFMKPLPSDLRVVDP